MVQTFLDKLKAGDGVISAALWIGLGIVILIVVIFLGAWIIRAVRPTLNMSGGSSRGGRPQRLAVTDAFNLDREGRKLVIIRRDNTEHLLLIGGPNDVVVEANILRGERTVRDRTGRDSGETVFPAEVTPQPEPARTPPPAAATLPPAPALAPPMAASTGTTMPPMRPVAPPPPLRPPPTPPAPPPLPAPPPGKAGEAAQGASAKLDDEFERALAAMQSVQRQQTTMPPPPRPPEPAMVQRPAPSPQPMPQMMPPMSAEAVPAAPRPAMPAASMPQSPSQTVTPRPFRPDAPSEMARRLNEVMQKPLNSAPKPAAMDTQVPAMPRAATPAPPPPLAASAPGSEMDMLEEEMARLLGRPSPQRKPDAP